MQRYRDWHDRHWAAWCRTLFAACSTRSSISDFCSTISARQSRRCFAAFKIGGRLTALLIPVGTALGLYLFWPVIRAVVARIGTGVPLNPGDLRSPPPKSLVRRLCQLDQFGSVDHFRLCFLARTHVGRRLFSGKSEILFLFLLVADRMRADRVDADVFLSDVRLGPRVASAVGSSPSDRDRRSEGSVRLGSTARHGIWVWRSSPRFWRSSLWR